jgi:hypothetical protein
MKAVAKILLFLLVALYVSPAATAERAKEKDDPPTELWEAFPLRPQPAKPKPPAVVTEAPPERPVSPDPTERPVSPDSTERPAAAARGDETGLPAWFLVTLLGAAGAAVALALVLRHAQTALLGDAVPMPGRGRRRERSPGAVPNLTRLATYAHAQPDLAHPQTPGERRPSHDVAGRIEAAEAIERRLHEAGSPLHVTGDLRPVPPIREPEPMGLERCSISVWQGFERSRFVAMPVDGGRREKIAESPVFRIAGVHTPERTATAEKALAEIVGELERRGWSVVGHGPDWFDRVLERPEEDRAR